MNKSLAWKTFTTHYVFIAGLGVMCHVRIIRGAADQILIGVDSRRTGMELATREWSEPPGQYPLRLRELKARAECLAAEAIAEAEGKVAVEKARGEP